MIHPALRGARAVGFNDDIQDGYESYPDANEIMRGPVTFLGSKQGPQRVILTVFKTSVDHFALVYPDNRRKMVAVKPVGCINIRGVTCEETTLGNGIKGFTLRPKKCDTSSAALTFVCREDKSASLTQWIEALTPDSALNNLTKRKIPKQCALQSVCEEEE